MSRNKQYLFVPMEDVSLAHSLGARWDSEAEGWYVDSACDLSVFSRWLPRLLGGRPEVVSDTAYIASLRMTCWDCGGSSEVIYLHCLAGLVNGTPCRQFTMMAVIEMEPWLAAWLEAADLHFQKEQLAELSPSGSHLPATPVSVYVNCCEHCGEVHEAVHLEKEAEELLHTSRPALKGSRFRFVPIPGTVRVSGPVMTAKGDPPAGISVGRRAGVPPDGPGVGPAHRPVRWSVRNGRRRHSLRRRHRE